MSWYCHHKATCIGFMSVCPLIYLLSCFPFAFYVSEWEISIPAFKHKGTVKQYNLEMKIQPKKFTTPFWTEGNNLKTMRYHYCYFWLAVIATAGRHFLVQLEKELEQPDVFVIVIVFFYFDFFLDVLLFLLFFILTLFSPLLFFQVFGSIKNTQKMNWSSRMFYYCNCF